MVGSEGAEMLVALTSSYWCGEGKYPSAEGGDAAPNDQRKAIFAP